MITSLVQLAQRFLGTAEIPGAKTNPLIEWWLSLCHLPEEPDETPWCSAFLNGLAWILAMPRSHSAAARSWLAIGKEVPLKDARSGNDIVVLKRGAPPKGHVGLYISQDLTHVKLLGGNQGDEVSYQDFPIVDILAVRRLG